MTASADGEPGWAPQGPEFDSWHFWMAVNLMYHARLPGSSPPVSHMAETPEALAAMIRATAPPWWKATW